MQGSVPILAGALFACAGPPSATTPPAIAYPWLVETPSGCAVGASGPTHDPGDAIRQARRNAIENVAAERLGVRVDSELRISASGASEVTRQEIDGVIANTRIVAMGSAPVASGPNAGQRQTHALACAADARVEGLPQPGSPAWLLEAPSTSSRLCVPGVGGPTRRPGDQREAALRDGRRALSHALESRIRRLSLDDGRGLAHVRSTTASTERARAIADGVQQLEAEWRDEDGRGPIGLPGILYGLVCVDL